MGESGAAAAAGESAVAAAIAEQTADERTGARFSAKSPAKSLRHDLNYEEPVSQHAIDLAERAGASPNLLKRAREALAKQTSAATVDASADEELATAGGDVPPPAAAEKGDGALDLTSELDDEHTAARKKKKPMQTWLKAPTAAECIRDSKKRKSALQREAAAGTSSPAAQQDATAAAASTSPPNGTQGTREPILPGSQFMPPESAPVNSTAKIHRYRDCARSRRSFAALVPLEPTTRTMATASPAQSGRRLRASTQRAPKKRWSRNPV